MAATGPDGGGWTAGAGRSSSLPSPCRRRLLVSSAPSGRAPAFSCGPRFPQGPTGAAERPRGTAHPRSRAVAPPGGGRARLPRRQPGGGGAGPTEQAGPLGRSQKGGTNGADGARPMGRGQREDRGAPPRPLSPPLRPPPADKSREPPPQPPHGSRAGSESRSGARQPPPWGTASRERISSGSTLTSPTPAGARRSWVRPGPRPVMCARPPAAGARSALGLRSPAPVAR